VYVYNVEGIECVMGFLESEQQSSDRLSLNADFSESDANYSGDYYTFNIKI